MTQETTAAKEIKGCIIRIKMVDGTTINGQVNIKRGEGYDRLSDLIGSTREPFLVVLNAIVYNDGLDNPVKHKTIFVNKNHIAYAMPDDSQD